MTFVDRPLPETLELPRLAEPRPRHNGKANLRYGPGTGRRKGSQDKITRDLKEGIIEGAVQVGFDGAGLDGLVGYCRWMAMYHPKAYAHLLAKLLPYNLNAKVASAGINTVNIVSIPSGVHLSHEQIECVQRGEPFTIDHGPTTEAPIEAPNVPEIEAQPKSEIDPPGYSIAREEIDQALVDRFAHLSLEELKALAGFE